jgi:MFS family permease
LTGLLLLALGLLTTGAVQSVVVVAATFLVAGFGNGLLLVYERLLIQATVPDRLVGRVFGAKDALTAWAFGIAFVAGGALVSTLGPRGPILIAGGAALVVYLAAVVALRDEWRGDEPLALDGRADALSGDRVVGEDGSDVVGDGERLRVETLDNTR